METNPIETTGRVRWRAFDTPEGTWRLAGTDRGICRVGLPGEEPAAFFGWLRRCFPPEAILEDPGALQAAAEEVVARAAGRTHEGAAPLDLRGTPFRISVWREVLCIPPGKTATYGEIARLLGRPEAPRAVGAAVAANPVPVLVPTHRVVAADGSLPGYGIEVVWKERLLAAEGVPR